MTEKPGFICMQCALKTFVAQLERGEDPLLADRAEGRAGMWINETPAEHMRSTHPDPLVTQLERIDLELRAMEGFEALKRRRAAGLANADNN